MSVHPLARQFHAAGRQGSVIVNMPGAAHFACLFQDVHKTHEAVERQHTAQLPLLHMTGWRTVATSSLHNVEQGIADLDIQAHTVHSVSFGVNLWHGLLLSRGKAGDINHGIW